MGKLEVDMESDCFQVVQYKPGMKNSEGNMLL